MKRSKRIISLFLFLLVLFSTFNVFAVRHPVRDIPLNGIIVNDHIVYSDVYPYIKNSRTYVPIRFIAEELGYDVKWDGANKKVIMKNGNTNVELTIGSNKMKVNGKTLTLDAPAEIKDDRTFVPLRAIAESFGEKVDYSKDYKAVYIGDNPVYNKNYKVVYYYEGANPVITDYTVNIVTLKLTINSEKVLDCDSMESLLTVLFADIDNYRTSGVSKLGTITTYKTLNNSSSSNTTVNNNNAVRINKIEDLANNKSSSSQEPVYYRLVDEKDFLKTSYLNDNSEVIFYVYYIDDFDRPYYIKYLDGTMESISTREEILAEKRRIEAERKGGKSLKEASTANTVTSKSSDDDSYNLRRNNKSYVDYLRSKDTDASDVYYTTPKEHSNRRCLRAREC